MIDCLDNDWDPEAHDRLVAKLFGDDYYCASTADDALDEAPKGESDEEDNFFMQNLDTGDYDDYLPRKVSCATNSDRLNLSYVSLENWWFWLVKALYIFFVRDVLDLSSIFRACVVFI